ncbi:hypothetical protein P7F88_09360 [Vibrio hannami]|uniref:hypothetical protein n=1 Tax=Vibrio hannami TaxID=2717094 RepID=UPI00241047B9|nr:hypothetical protein [Vibrio hannami]MDG3086302.1 hypothetical protein [Vibrio hannami]
MKLRNLGLVAGICLVTSAAFASDNTANKYSNFTPEQLLNLPHEELNSEVPTNYTQAAQLATSPFGEITFTMNLNTLMYPATTDLQAAVKQFQMDLDTEPTGVLTISEIETLGYRASMQKLSRVFFPSEFSSSKSDVSAHIKGTVMLQNDTIAWPVNYTEINCYKAQNFCSLGQIYLVIPDEDSYSQNYQVGKSKPDFFTITEWKENQIIAIPDSGDNSDDCVAVTLELNFSTQEFYLLTKNGNGECAPTFEKPQIAQVVDGTAIYDAEFTKVSDKAFSFLSSQFQETVNNIVKESN